MPIKLKGSKVKKISSGSEKSKSVKLKDLKDLVEKKPTAAVVVSAMGGAAASLAGVKFKMTLPGGKSQSGVIDASGGMGAQLEKEGNTKLELTSLVAALNVAPAPANQAAPPPAAASNSPAEDKLKVSVDKEVAGHNETLTFRAEGNNSGGTVNWSGGGTPATGTGNEFVTRFTAKGDHTIQASLNGQTDSKKVTIKEASGSAWVDRFPTSTSTGDLVAAFKTSVDNFIAALEAAGATVSISATYRPAERAYLMHYSYKVAKSGLDPASVPAMAGVDICWLHRDANGDPDVPASRTAAQQMVDGYGIVYAPALQSRHTQKRAIDMNISWSGNLTIKNASGDNVTISTTPRTGAGNTHLHDVGATYGVEKLASDAPHWSDDGH